MNFIKKVLLFFTYLVVSALLFGFLYNNYDIAGQLTGNLIFITLGTYIFTGISKILRKNKKTKVSDIIIGGSTRLILNLLINGNYNILTDILPAFLAGLYIYIYDFRLVKTFELKPTPFLRISAFKFGQRE